MWMSCEIECRMLRRADISLCYVSKKAAIILVTLRRHSMEITDLGKPGGRQPGLDDGAVPSAAASTELAKTALFHQ